jgi:hypothetical protein
MKALKVFAVLFILLAISNFMKPLEMSPEHGFVFLGHRLSGTANLLAGPLFGTYLAAYAFGILKLRAWALPMGIAYALYVVTNLALFMTSAPPEETSNLAFGIAYSTIAIGVSAGAAGLLWSNRERLG